MRICYIGDAGSVHIQRWVRFFADKGHEICLISPRRGQGELPPGVDLHVLRLIGGIRGLNILLSVLQIASIVRRNPPDLIHAHHVTGCGFWAALCRLHPHVLTAWGSDIVIQPGKSKLVKWKATYALKNADIITCDAEHMAVRMGELGVSRDKIKIINFGVDTVKFSCKGPEDKDKLDLQLPSDSQVVISMRSLYPIYDLETLIKAVPLVLGAAPKARFIIVGGGEQRAYLESLATSLGVIEQVRFVGAICSDDIPRYLNAADVYVSTSLSDAGLAASTAEAMACELPVVITDFGDNSEWVKNGEGGFLVPLKSPAPLADAIIYLLKNESMRRASGKINRETIRDRNDYYKEMEKVEGIYRAVAGHG